MNVAALFFKVFFEHLDSFESVGSSFEGNVVALAKNHLNWNNIVQIVLNDQDRCETFARLGTYFHCFKDVHLARKWFCILFFVDALDRLLNNFIFWESEAFYFCATFWSLLDDFNYAIITTKL